MDSSSRKIVSIIAIITFVILVVIAGNLYTGGENAESTAVAEPPEPRNDDSEAAIAKGSLPSQDSEFSTEIPKSEEIPAINGEPSMVFDNDANNNPPVAKESTKGIAGPSSSNATLEIVE